MPRRTLAVALALSGLLAGAATTVVLGRDAATAGTGGGAAPAGPRQVAAAAAGAAVPVAPLRHLSQPDVVVQADTAISARQLARLRSAARARSAAVLDVGTMRVAGTRVRAIGVDASEFRGFTPPATAAADLLWGNLARGDLAVSYSLARRGGLPALGQPVTVSARAMQTPRLGAFADLGLPRVDVIVGHATAAALGLPAANGVVLSAPGRSTRDIVGAVRAVLGPGARITSLRGSGAVAAGKPRTYRELYQAAARTCPGLSWTVLAAIGQVESDHGVNAGPSSAGALGPMQFMPATWAQWARDGDGDGHADIMNPYDSVYAAAAYLCHDGAGLGGAALARAIYAYNHADWYVDEVLSLAKLYR